MAPNMRTDLEVEDMLLVNGKMADGCTLPARPVLVASGGTSAGARPRLGSLSEADGSQPDDRRRAGTLMADCFGPNVYHNGAPNDRYTVQYTYFDEWIGMVDEFVDCVRNGRTPQINLRWHRRTIEAMNACYESIAAGQPIAF